MAAATTRMEILMVEDSPGAVRLAIEAVRDAQLDSNLNVAEDGVAALDYLYRRPPHTDAVRPDLILLDLNLPRKNGYEVLDVIRHDPSLSAIPVVVMSTSQAEYDVARAYELHANCYVVKPVDYMAFVDLIKGLRRFMQPQAGD